MKRSRGLEIGFLCVAALYTAAPGYLSAQDFEHPRKAKQLKFALTQAFLPCGGAKCFGGPDEGSPCAGDSECTPGF
jgi:hypothetical protein